jgi:hypothetical protein
MVLKWLNVLQRKMTPYFCRVLKEASLRVQAPRLDLKKNLGKDLHNGGHRQETKTASCFYQFPCKYFLWNFPGKYPSRIQDKNVPSVGTYHRSYLVGWEIPTGVI